MSSRQPETTARIIQRAAGLRPSLAIVLGSGFHSVAGKVEIEAKIDYGELPGFPPPGVPGHPGQLLVGNLNGTSVAVLSGRAHYYEGHDLHTVTFAVRTMAAWGIKDLLLTNAAGGINRRFKVGDLMVITDHINFMGMNPLRGSPRSLNRFIDMTRAYDRELAALVQEAGEQVGVRLRKGVYLAVSGPSYETPAEIRAFAGLGADAVGMSTVPEVIVARQCGLRVAALSCITNLAAGVGRGELSHAEVLGTAGRVKDVAAEVLSVFAKLYRNGR